MEICLVIIACVLALISIVLLVWWSICIWMNFYGCPNLGPTIWDWIQLHETFAIGFVTILLLTAAGIFAVLQLMSMRKSRYAELLMQLDEQWESEPLIKIRQQIDKKRRSIYEELQKENVPEPELEKKAKEKMGEMGVHAYEKADEEAFQILGLLGFLETLAFLTQHKYIPQKDIRDTFGAVITNYYDLFEDYIMKIRQEPYNRSAYKELQDLADKYRPHILGL